MAPDASRKTYIVQVPCVLLLNLRSKPCSSETGSGAISSIVAARRACDVPAICKDGVRRATSPSHSGQRCKPSSDQKLFHGDLLKNPEPDAGSMNAPHGEKECSGNKKAPRGCFEAGDDVGKPRKHHPRDQKGVANTHAFSNPLLAYQ